MIVTPLYVRGASLPRYAPTPLSESQIIADLRIARKKTSAVRLIAGMLALRRDLPVASTHFYPRSVQRFRSHFEMSQ